MTLRIGTRASALAVAQSSTVARALEGLGAEVELIEIATSGDERPGGADGRGDADGPGRAGAPAPDTSDKARFVNELERALLAGEIDLAVHSAKDVPGVLPDGLAIAGVPERADPRDSLCLPPTRSGSSQDSPGRGEADAASAAGALAGLREGARVGTASVRRRAQLLAARPDLEIVELRGNVDTRLRKLAEDRLDAIVLAAAGLARLGRSDAGTPLSGAALLPAPGQGCLALEARADDAAARALADRLTDAAARAALTAERALVTGIDATCDTPVGAHATIDGDALLLRSIVGAPDGASWIRDKVTAPAADPATAGAEAAERLLAAGAAELLAAS